MRRKRRFISRVMATCMAFICTVSVISVKSIRTRAFFNDEGGLEWSPYYSKALSAGISFLVSQIPYAGPLLSDSVAEFVMKAFGLEVKSDEYMAVEEVNGKLMEMSETLDRMSNQLEHNENVRAFNELANRIDHISDEYVNILAEISKNEKKELTPEEKQDLEKVKREKLPAVVGDPLKDDSFYNSVQILSKYLLGRGLGQTNNVIDSYFDYQKGLINDYELYGYVVYRPVSTYASYAMEIYSKAVEVLVFGLYSKKDLANSVEKGIIENQIQNILDDASEVNEMYRECGERMQEERYKVRVPIQDKDGNEVDTEEIQLKGKLEHQLYDRNDPHWKIKSNLDFVIARNIVRTCPEDMTLREYLEAAGFEVERSIQYLAVSEMKDRIGQYWDHFRGVKMDDVTKTMASYYPYRQQSVVHLYLNMAVLSQAEQFNGEVIGGVDDIEVEDHIEDEAVEIRTTTDKTPSLGESIIKAAGSAVINMSMDNSSSSLGEKVFKAAVPAIVDMAKTTLGVDTERSGSSSRRSASPSSARRSASSSLRPGSVGRRSASPSIRAASPSMRSGSNGRASRPLSVGRRSGSNGRSARPGTPGKRFSMLRSSSSSLLEPVRSKK